MKKLLLSIGIGMFSMFGFAQMSGTYTIDASQATGGTNFQTWNDAFDELTTNGVNGAVTINVLEATYNEVLTYNNAEISGSSAANHITIQSDASNSNMPILTNSSYAIYWQFCDFSHLTIKGINIASTSSFGRTVYIRYGSMDSVIFEDNVIDHATTFSTFYAYAAVYTEYVDCENFMFLNNEMNNGAAGFVNYRNTGDYSDNLIVEGNTINDNYYYGIYDYHISSGCQVHYTDNVIDLNTSYQRWYGIYTYYTPPGSSFTGNIIEGTTTYNSWSTVYQYGWYSFFAGRDYGNQETYGNITIEGNQIIVNNSTASSVYSYGMYDQYLGGSSSCDDNLVANNMVTILSGGRYSYAGYFRYPSNTDITNNSFYCAQATTWGTYGFYLWNSSSSYGNMNIMNNQMVREFSGSGYTAYVYASTNAGIAGNNLFYDASSSGMYVYWRFPNYSLSSSLAQYELNSGTTGNFNEDPMWVSNTDHHYNTSNLSLIEHFDGSGAPISFDYDFDDDFRISSLPDVGPDEFGAANNASPGQALTPPIPYCGTDSCLTITVVNTGTSPLTSVNVHWSLNGVAQPTLNWTGNLGLGAQDTVDLSCTINWQDGDDVRIYTALPNGVLDSLAANDTIDIELFYGLSGTYSIPGNYSDIKDAVDDLNQRGVCSATVFDIAPGTYSGDSIELRNIIGTSATNTVTWKSSTGNADDVKIEYAGNFNVNYVVGLWGTEWQIFEDLTFENTQTSTFGYGSVVYMTANSSNNIFQRCNLVTMNTTTTSSNMSNVWYDGGSNENNLFWENHVMGGSYGFNLQGGGQGDEENIRIIDNDITDWYYMGIYDYYMDSSDIVGNLITAQMGNGYSNSYGIRSYYSDGSNIDQNTIYGDNNYGIAYGIEAYYNDGSGANPVTITNNCITVGNPDQSGWGYNGLRWWYGNYGEISGNTFTKVGGSTGGSYSAMYVPGGNALKMMNNSFANYAGGNAVYISQPWSFVNSDNNNYYSVDSSSTIYFGGSTYANALELSETSGTDMHSINVDPVFGDTMACATCEATLNDLGTPAVSSMMDVNGAMRSATTPDIGAVEYYPLVGFSLGEDSVVCATEFEINLSPTANTTWSVNGTVVNNPVATLTTTGATEEFEVFLNINSEACGLITDNVTYTLVPNAMLDSSMHLCMDEMAVINPGGSVTDNYVWSNGETTQAIEINEGGVYTVSKEGMGCESSATILVTQSVGVNVDDAEDCSSNGAISVDATIFNGVSYAWSAGNSLNTAQNTFNDAGFYYVSATDAYGCTSSDSFNVYLLEEPTAIIDEEHSGFIYIFDGTSSNYVTSNSTYSWDFGNGQTSTNSGETITYPWANPSSPITYNVILTVNNGCGEHTTQMEITPDPLGVGSVKEGAFTLYPNPTSNMVNFTLANSANSEGTIEVMDLSGRVIMNQVITAGQANGEVNVTDLAAGSYLVKVSVDGASTMNTLIKQ